LESSCVPQTHTPTAEGEVDFHDLWVVLRGVKTKTALFTMRLWFSGRAAHRGFAVAGPGGVPGRPRLRLRAARGCAVGQIRYDNLKPAVSRVLCGRTRHVTQRWVMFRSHHGFDPFDGRVRRPGQAPRRPPHPRRRLPPRQAHRGVRLRRQQAHQSRGDPPAQHLRLGQSRAPALSDRRLRHRQDTCSIGLGTAAAESGFRVRYCLASKLVNEFVEDQGTTGRTRPAARLQSPG